MAKASSTFITSLASSYVAWAATGMWCRCARELSPKRLQPRSASAYTQVRRSDCAVLP